ncbi:CGNR zinc finger domain-containing protein [Actinomadura alba]|uniref:CGNR zinc finger domain-containing protein n=1 Tax=Actinomadura alba TaxID=406431 RepID=A0ABR7LY70_9ACTN|nr:CGNR zinc finger domain-containing protein [Actinomadura alba]MBC6469807.1 CGNR zinc finger domain-containing protein [Actinomadura alba]
MDLASYADLVIELVNTQDPVQDSLRDLDSLQTLLEIRPHLSGRLTRRDLDAMRDLRGELRMIFTSAVSGRHEDAIERLNSLLIQHPIHPQLSGHDGQDWHMHLTEGGSVPDRYAAGASMGLAVYVSTHGIERLGICQAPLCAKVYFDTTANRSRRHCSDLCASRADVAAYRARRRENAEAEIGGRDCGR